MGEQVAVDLHIHSALSPCSAEEMRPPAVLLTAEQRGLAMVGIVDHSTAGNAAAFLEAAPAFALRVLVGLEVESAEGVHVLALFDTAEAAGEMERQVAAHLPARRNDPRLLGRQLRVDEWGEVVAEEERLLLVAASLRLEEIAEQTAALGGLSLPAHVDRRANGLLPTLGFVPPGLPVDLLELSPHLTPEEARARWPELTRWGLVSSSDAHNLADIGRAVTPVPQELVEDRRALPEWGRELAQRLREGGDA